MVVGIRDQWSLCCRPVATYRKSERCRMQGACPSHQFNSTQVGQTSIVLWEALKERAYPWDLLNKRGREKMSQRCAGSWYQGVYTNLAQLYIKDKAMKVRASGAWSIRISASYFLTQAPPVPFCCHTIPWEQNLLAQLLESNCRLITCAGMWVGTLSMCVGASGNMSLRKNPFSPQKHCSTTGIPSDLYSFKL